jgi:hypothetical protein
MKYTHKPINNSTGVRFRRDLNLVLHQFIDQFGVGRPEGGEILAIDGAPGNLVAIQAAFDVYLRHRAVANVVQKLGIAQGLGRAVHGRVVIENRQEDHRDDRPGQQVLDHVVKRFVLFFASHSFPSTRRFRGLGHPLCVPV